MQLDYKVVAFGITCAVTLSGFVIFVNDIKNDNKRLSEYVERLERQSDAHHQDYLLLQSQVNSQKYEIKYFLTLVDRCKDPQTQ